MLAYLVIHVGERKAMGGLKVASPNQLKFLLEMGKKKLKNLNPKSFLYYLHGSY